MRRQVTQHRRNSVRGLRYRVRHVFRAYRFSNNPPKEASLVRVAIQRELAVSTVSDNLFQLNGLLKRWRRNCQMGVTSVLFIEDELPLRQNRKAGASQRDDHPVLAGIS